MIELLKAGIGEDGNGSALNRTPSHPLRRHIPVTRVSVQNVSLFSPYILYRAKHNHQSWIRLLFFFFFFFLVSQFFPASFAISVLRFTYTRSFFERRAITGWKGPTPLLSKIKSLLLRPYVYATIVSWQGRGVDGGSTPARKLRHEAERVYAWAEQTADSRICVTLQTKSNVRSGSSGIIICWERVFFFSFFPFLGPKSNQKIGIKLRNWKFSNARNLIRLAYLYLLRFLYFTLYVVIIQLCIMYNIISSLINARVGSALIV